MWSFDHGEQCLEHQVCSVWVLVFVNIHGNHSARLPLRSNVKANNSIYFLLAVQKVTTCPTITPKSENCHFRNCAEEKENS